MKHTAKRACLALMASLVFALVAGFHPARAVPIPIDDTGRTRSAATGIETMQPPLQGQGADSALSTMLGKELQRGSWRRACSIATDALGRGEQNVDALGVFGMCAALRNDQAAANKAQQRLREAEGTPYYVTLTQGILQLRSGAADKADTTFKTFLRSHADDPLALYFDGEAQHQLKRDPQAIESFKAVLKRWPDHAPALASAAQLLAAPKASPRELKEAMAMMERATAIEPMNLDYWKQMADLCDRTGQHDRAAALRIQWLTPPSAK